MFTSLRMRLFQTYVMLVVLTLSIIAAALIIILVNNPAPLGQSYRHLADIARASLPYLKAAPSDQLDTRLDDLAQLNGIRVMRLHPDGTVLYDSLRETRVSQKIDITPARSVEPGLNRSFYRASDGQIWLAQTYNKDLSLGSPADQLIVFSTPRPRNRVIALLDDFLLPVLEAGAIGVLLSILFAVLMSNWVSGPLARTAAAASAMANGDYGQKAPTEGPREVRDLAQTFNDMVAQVRTTNQTQRDFLANVSHELKTPLPSIQGFAQAILDGASTRPADSARVIYDEAGRMRRLVDDLLDLARIESGHSQLNRQPIDLGQLLHHVEQSFGLRAAEKHIEFAATVGTTPAITGDADRLVQVFNNLLENALGHTPQGGQIEVKAEAAPGGVQIAFANTGKGIPPADLQRVFERFYQADKSRARTGQRGTGLGLTICREIIQAHGGTIHVESVEGQGATFYVWLPLPRHTDETARRPINVESG